MAFPSGSCWPQGSSCWGFFFLFLSWKQVKGSTEAALEPGGEMTWGTGWGQRPPRGGFGELPGAEGDLPALVHHPPSSCWMGGWQRSGGHPQPPPHQGDPGFALCFPFGTEAPGRAGGRAPSTIPTHTARQEGKRKMPTEGAEGSAPRFSVPHREEFFPISQLISHLHHHKPSGVSAHLALGAIPKPLIPADAPSPSVWVLCPDGK